jgi:MFS family permease
MLVRFCLYGFLKNQKYFEPFLILVFLEKGLSFFLIGILIATRELTINLFEVISGAVADIYGRRRCMIGSFSAYIVSFIIFGIAGNMVLLLVAMFLFGIGDAFRTGTHKAMIFSWLRLEGRAEERTQIYGQTRSWSKIGSATSVIIAAIIVITSSSYLYVFYLSIVPYLLGIINFLYYPKELDGIIEKKPAVGEVFKHLKESVFSVVKKHELRRLVIESMGFEGLFKSTKDYLQPVLESTAIMYGMTFSFLAAWGHTQKTAVVVGITYFILFLLSAAASRNSYVLVNSCKTESKAAKLLWGLLVLCFANIAVAIFIEQNVWLIVGFIGLYVLQNFWRPMLIGRIDACCQPKQAATVLSIESQAKSLAAVVLAPGLGFLVDLVKVHQFGPMFWPLGVLGIVVAFVFFVVVKHK